VRNIEGAIETVAYQDLPVLLLNEVKKMAVKVNSVTEAVTTVKSGTASNIVLSLPSIPLYDTRELAEAALQSGSLYRLTQTPHILCISLA
jgi:hypothetical protein